MAEEEAAEDFVDPQGDSQEHLVDFLTAHGSLYDANREEDDEDSDHSDPQNQYHGFQFPPHAMHYYVGHYPTPLFRPGKSLPVPYTVEYNLREPPGETGPVSEHPNQTWPIYWDFNDKTT